jgi:hypothetical protein
MRKNRSKPPKTNHSKKRLQPLQLQAIGLLAAGQKQIVIVERLGVSSSTLNRWLNSAAFVSELDRRIVEARTESERALKCLFSSAVAAIDRLLTDPETPANVAAQVAFKVLEWNSSDLVATHSDKSKATITPEILTEIREKIYGIYD